eukprot:CAMPEP_0184320890 /NCGR_PEP_ID=MMETSP1049-20130417/116349_1 /TAXON_ID=77928 /ORGANISM="Proteomonas sulcata, Strain CCMP704" /LENGTH=100 /DNA_ID=CAMNT_0026641531 /DNA_START=106 /DNA_END=408 /DNA_ORIENTATION=-
MRTDLNQTIVSRNSNTAQDHGGRFETQTTVSPNTLLVALLVPYLPHIGDTDMSRSSASGLNFLLPETGRSAPPTLSCVTDPRSPDIVPLPMSIVPHGEEK